VIIVLPILGFMLGALGVFWMWYCESMTAPKIKSSDIARICSGIFLTDEFPKDWEMWTFESQLMWIQAHKWEQVERMSSDDILEQIECATYGVEELIRSRGIEVVE
jgi:hypothetical protein